MGQVGGMDGNSEGLDLGSRGIVKRVGHGEAGVGRHVHPLAEAAIVRVEAAEMQPPAEVGVALFAHLATTAWLCGIHCHPRSGS